MNKLIYFLFFILFTPFVVLGGEDDDYETSIVYDYMMEPFLKLDSNIDKVETFQVTHCSAKGEPGKWIKYSSLGNCLYSQIPVSEKNEQSFKEVIAHIETHNKEKFNFSIKWKAFTIIDVWRFYKSESNGSLIGAQVIVESQREPLNNFLHSILMSLTNQQASLDPRLSMLFQWKDIYSFHIQVHSSSSNKDVVDIQVSFRDQENNVLLSYVAETDYYIGADNFFFQSGQ